MTLCCRICQKELTQKDSLEYYRCLVCLVRLPEAPDKIGMPSRYAIQFNKGSLLKETLCIDKYIIDYRPDINETVIGMFVWNAEHSIPTYQLVMTFNSKVFDFSNLNQTENRLKMFLVFQ